MCDDHKRFFKKIQIANATLSSGSLSKSPFIECQMHRSCMKTAFSSLTKKKTGILKYLMEYKISAVV